MEINETGNELGDTKKRIALLELKLTEVGKPLPSSYRSANPSALVNGCTYPSLEGE